MAVLVGQGLHTVRAVILSVAVSLFVFGACGGSVARADDTPPAPMIGVVDLRGVVTASAAGASVMKQRDSLRAGLKASVAKEEKALREADQALTRSRTLVTAEAFAEKQKAQGARIVETQRSVEIRRRGIDMAAGEGLDKLEKKVLEIAAKIARDRNMNIVLHTTQTVFFDGKFDISRATLDALNKELPTLALRDPAAIIAEAKAKQKSSPENTESK